MALLHLTVTVPPSGPLGDFAKARFDVANVGRHGEDENVSERTAH